MPDSTGLRILVVDDDDALARLLAVVLEQAGFGTPRTARTGAEALPAAADADVILLDHQLPDAGGLDLIPAIRAAPSHPAVILITAYGDETLAATALRLGADDYLVKDGTLPRIVPQVVERVRRHRALREALAAAERDLVHAERLAAIGELNVTLHHTVNNPLMAASAEVDLLLAGGEDLTAEQRASVLAIKAAIQRIREIIERVGSLGHDGTVEYLDGVSMIDLSRRTLPTPLQRGEAVVLLPDEDVARVVSLLLKHAGFKVDRVSSPALLAQRAGRLGVAVVVVAGAAAGAADPLGGFRPSEPRTYTLVAMMPGDGAAARAAGADHVISLPFDPGAFVSELLAVMGR